MSLLAAARVTETTVTFQRAGVIVFAVVVFLVVFELVRRRALMERYALLWLGAAVVLVVLAVWRGLLTSVSGDLHIYTPVNALFAAGFVFTVALLLHFSMVISRLSEQNKVLAQRLALLDQRVGTLEQGPELANDDDPVEAGTRAVGKR